MCTENRGAVTVEKRGTMGGGGTSAGYCLWLRACDCRDACDLNLGGYEVADGGAMQLDED